jgi:hypothetical protein
LFALRENLQIAKHPYAFFFLWLLIFAAVLATGGGEIKVVLLVPLFVFGYSAPTFLYLTNRIAHPYCLAPALLVSLVATTILGSLMFSFTSISTHPQLIWVGLVGAIIGASVIGRSKVIRDSDYKSPEHSLFGTLIASITLILGAALLRISFPFREDDPQWLPDDFPFFAMVAQDTSMGNPGEAFFNGLTFNYHWLTYSFFGGINRLVNVGQIIGILVIGTLISWMLLVLGAISIVQSLSKRRLPLIIAPLAVVFASSVGLYAYSTYGLGDSIVSPSTLLTSAWFFAVLITVQSSTTSESVNKIILPIIMGISGFALGLGKISTAVITVVGIVSILGFTFIFQRNSTQNSFTLLVKHTSFTVFPFLIGMGIASFLFLRSTETELGIEGSLVDSNATSPYQWLVFLLPTLVSVFSFAVMAFPVLIPTTRWRTNGLFLASAVLSVSGLLAIFFFDFGSGNEAWFLTAAFALILPASSVLVADFLTAKYSLSPLRHWIQAMLIVVLVIPTAILLLVFGDSKNLEVRPWLVPTTLLVLALVFGILWTWSQGSISMYSTVRSLKLVSAFLFLLAIAFGLLGRIDAAIIKSNSTDQITMKRDAWIQQTYLAALDFKDQIGSAPIAIYSNSPGETTLTRWIPYFLHTQAYVVSSEDELPDFYSPFDEMLERQQLVRDFVLSRDANACRKLQGDGIGSIWITQGINLDSSGSVVQDTPRVIPVACN